MRVSAVHSRLIFGVNLVVIFSMFKMFAAQELFPDARHSPRINLEQNQISFEMFQRGLKAIKLQLSPDQETSLFKRIDSDGSGSIDYVSC